MKVHAQHRPALVRAFLRTLTCLGAQALLLSFAFKADAALPGPEPLSPADIVASADGKTLFVAGATGSVVLEFDVASASVRRAIRVPESPLGLALSQNGKQLVVTCAAPESKVAVIDIARGKVTQVIPAGHTAVAPVISAEGNTLYVCNRFNNEVAFISLPSGKVTARVAVPREPVAAALTPDGRLLFVANHLHAGRADLDPWLHRSP